MAVRFPLLVLLLAAISGGCATATEERLTRLESVVTDLQAQDIRIAMLEDRVNEILGGNAAPVVPDAARPVPAARAPQAVNQTAPASPAVPGEREPARAPRPVSAASAPAPVQPVPDKPAPSAKAVPTKTKRIPAQIERQYQVALSTLESGRPKAAMELFRAFVQEHPEHALAPNAAYWLGECYYSLKEYASAINAFKDVVALYPQHDKASAAMLKAGYSYAQLGNTPDARFYLEALLRDYPSSPPATLARARLAAL